MATFQYYPGQEVLLSLSILNAPGVSPSPVVGESATVSVRRLSDDKWWDFTGEVWVTAASFAVLPAGCKQFLVDKLDGNYEVLWDQGAADGSVDGEYQAVYQVLSGDYSGMAYDILLYSRDLGAGPKSVKIRVVNQLSEPIQGIVVRIKNIEQTKSLGLSQTTDENGTTPFGFGLDENTEYRVVCKSMGIYAFANPYTIITSLGEGEETIDIMADELIINPPPAADYCTVYCIVETQGGAAATGTFEVVDTLAPPERVEEGLEEVTVIHKTQKVNLDANGIGQLAILQGSVVDLRLNTEGRDYSKLRRKIPAQASANWEDLEGPD